MFTLKNNETFVTKVVNKIKITCNHKTINMNVLSLFYNK